MSTKKKIIIGIIAFIVVCGLVYGIANPEELNTTPTSTSSGSNTGVVAYTVETIDNNGEEEGLYTDVVNIKSDQFSSDTATVKNQTKAVIKDYVSKNLDKSDYQIVVLSGDDTNPVIARWRSSDATSGNPSQLAWIGRYGEGGATSNETYNP